MWIRAESAEAVAADFRALAVDSGVPVEGMRQAEVVEEVRARIVRARCNYLLVFDNVTDREIIKPYLPRGFVGVGTSVASSSLDSASGLKGHVLITSRRLPVHNAASGPRVIIDCFSREESVSYLRRAAGPHGRVDELLASRSGSLTAAGSALAEALGDLPLALR